MFPSSTSRGNLLSYNRDYSCEMLLELNNIYRVATHGNSCRIALRCAGTIILDVRAPGSCQAERSSTQAAMLNAR